MKLHVLSDLHLTFDAFERPQTDADVVVLAGDIARPREAVAWAMEFAQPVLYVAGNHEFYGGSIEGTLAELKRLCEGTHVHLLDDSELVLEGVRFLGTTLWTDFGLFGAGERKAAATAKQRVSCATSAGSDAVNPQSRRSRPRTLRLFSTDTRDGWRQS